MFTSYGSVLALHHSRSICLTFLALGTAAGGHFWTEAADGLAWLWSRSTDEEVRSETSRPNRLRRDHSKWTPPRGGATHAGKGDFFYLRNSVI